MEVPWPLVCAGMAGWRTAINEDTRMYQRDTYPVSSGATKWPRWKWSVVLTPAENEARQPPLYYAKQWLAEWMPIDSESSKRSRDMLSPNEMFLLRQTKFCSINQKIYFDYSK
ncbi:hypothetical protein EAI_13628 [Harpegnathos saltator]|uniref:Uncharacterized protein n=1 Tax=Harpegnathos saltator TaxID=610380 RepID=E2BDV0_HARSA|nr:hypothetical protein EAI_13628 [Harpegnathos saltator]